MRWFQRRTADDDIADLLDQCLTRIERGGATVESCLAAYPRQAEALRPLLLTAMAARSVVISGPSAAAQGRMRAKLLAATAPRPMPAARRPLWQPALSAGLALALLAVLAVPLTALQSGDSVPGDWDYGLKRAGERVRLAVTVDDGSRRSVHLALAQRREREIQALLDQNRTEFIPDTVRALNVELASLTDSLTKERTISEAEARRISEITSRQETVLKQVVEQSPQQVAAIAQETRGTASAARSAAEQRTVAPERAQAPPSPALSSPAPTPSPRVVVPESTPAPSVSPVASESPAPSASPSATPVATPSPTPSATPLPTATPSASPSATPAATSAAASAGPSAAPMLPPLRTAAPATPAPAVPSTAPATASQPTLPPLRTPAPVTPAPVTPVPLAPAPIQPTPSPSATPTPAPPTRTSTTVPAPGVTLVPGIAQVFTYTGPAQSLLVLLAPAEGKYSYVSFRAPGGLLVVHRPGQSGGEYLTVSPGSEITIVVTDTVTLTW